ncbi:MAG TPA: TPM domain-containing protein, partial [Terriglobales bacterium]|nr:TPM domain-containing protein [Terriglobales bacterium]
MLCLIRPLLLLVLLLGGIGIRSDAGWADPPLPALTGRVVDQAAVLDRATAQRLTDELARYEAKTGTQIVVVTLPDMQGYPIEQWGLTLLRGWQIGQKGKNNGIVLVVAPKEHELRIETGYGAEGPLPDATADLIIRHAIVPRFKQSDYGGGIFAGVQAIE